MHEYIERILKDIGSLGSAAVFGIIIVLVFFIDRQLAIELFAGGITIFVLTSFIRIIHFKLRPKPKNYKNWIEKIDAASFPSTHAARSAFLLSILFPLLSEIYRILGIILVFTICYSRIVRKRHDFIDVLGGVIIGVAVGFMALRL